MKKPYVLCFLFLAWCLHSLAQKSSAVAASVDKTTILIGQPLQLTLEATFSNTHVPAFFTIDSLPHFEILNRSKIDTQAINGQTTLRQTITLTSWDSGAWIIPSLTVEKGSVTRPLPITITFSPMQPNQDYHDIKPIIDVQNPPRTTWYWYVIGAVIVLMLLFLIFPKKKKGEVEALALHEGAYKLALKDLETLHAKNALDDKTYFTELIQIFRTYLERGKGIHSFQKTTDDLSRQLQALQLPHEDLKKLVQALQLSDFVKFAQLNAQPEEREAAWQEIKKSITTIEPIKT